jgi:hypothetical protein
MNSKRPRIWSSWCLKDPNSVSPLALISQQKVRWFELFSSSSSCFTDDIGIKNINSEDSINQENDSQRIISSNSEDFYTKLRASLSQTILSYSSYNSSSISASPTSSNNNNNTENHIPEIASLKLCCAESISVKSRNYTSRISKGSQECVSPYATISIRIRKCAFHPEVINENNDNKEEGGNDEQSLNNSSSSMAARSIGNNDLVITPLSPVCTQAFFVALFCTGYNLYSHQGGAIDKRMVSAKQQLQDAIKSQTLSSSVGGFVIVHLPTSSASGGDLALVPLKTDTHTNANSILESVASTLEHDGLLSNTCEIFPFDSDTIEASLSRKYLASLGNGRMALIPLNPQNSGTRVRAEDVICSPPRRRPAMQLFNEVTTDSPDGRGGDVAAPIPALAVEFSPKFPVCQQQFCPAAGCEHTHVLLLPERHVAQVSDVKVSSWRRTNDCYGKTVTNYSVQASCGSLVWTAERRTADFGALFATLKAFERTLLERRSEKDSSLDANGVFLRHLEFPNLKRTVPRALRLKSFFIRAMTHTIPSSVSVPSTPRTDMSTTISRTPSRWIPQMLASPTLSSRKSGVTVLSSPSSFFSVAPNARMTSGKVDLNDSTERLEDDKDDNNNNDDDDEDDDVLDNEDKTRMSTSLTSNLLSSPRPALHVTSSSSITSTISLKSASESLQRSTIVEKPQERKRRKLDRWLQQLVEIPSLWDCPEILIFLGAAGKAAPDDSDVFVATGTCAPTSGKTLNSNTFEESSAPSPSPSPPSSSSTISILLPISRAEEVMLPGDILLFSCRNTPSVLQRAASFCRYDHAGIVVDLNEVDFLRKLKKNEESSSSSSSSLADSTSSSSFPSASTPYSLAILEASGPGVKTYPLTARLRAYGTGYCGAIAVRRLLLPGEEISSSDHSTSNTKEGEGDQFCSDSCSRLRRRGTRPNKSYYSSSSRAHGSCSRCNQSMELRRSLESRIAAFCANIKDDAIYSLGIGVSKIVLAQAHLQSLKCAQINKSQKDRPTRTLPSALQRPSAFESTPRKHYYCTELVASIYMAVGLIPATDSIKNYEDEVDKSSSSSVVTLSSSFPSAVLDARFFWPNAFVPITQTNTMGSLVIQPCVVDSLLEAWSGARLSDEIAVDCRYKPLSRASSKL